MLIAREVPPYGGDTLFANQYLAYETLSDGCARMLDGLVAVSRSAKAEVTRTREDRIRDDGKTEAKNEFVSEHPVVRTHPGNGAQGALRQYRPHRALQGHDARKKARPCWNIYSSTRSGRSSPAASTGARLAGFWDNRCALHNPVNDYHGFKRVMHRVTLAGDRPR